MINIVFKNISRFVLLIFIQILILNNIELSGFINPYIYVLFIILLPFDIPRWSLLVIGFITGITVDMFSNTLGMHTTATVFMAFCRPFILNMLINKEEIEGGISPNMNEFGFKWFLTYSSIMIFIHHTILFFSEAFRLKEMFYIILTIILSSLFTIFLVLLSQFFFLKSKKEKGNIKKIQF